MPKARERFVNGVSARVHSLADVWSTAAKKAKLAGLNDYGVLVTKEPDGDFLVLIEEKSPEKGYTLWECR
jgi:hypothetical protein